MTNKENVRGKIYRAPGTHSYSSAAVLMMDTLQITRNDARELTLVIKFAIPMTCTQLTSSSGGQERDAVLRKHTVLGNDRSHLLIYSTA